MKALITVCCLLNLWMFMCEFNVILDGKTEFRDVIYVKVDGDNVAVRDVMGESREFAHCRIVEVDVPNTRLVLKST